MRDISALALWGIAATAFMKTPQQAEQPVVNSLENMMQKSPTSTGVAASNPRLRVSPFRTVRVDWLARAAALPGRTLNYALAVFLLAGVSNSPVVVPGRRLLARYGVSRDAAGEALTRLTNAGLVRTDRQRGRAPTVVLLDAGGKNLVVTAGAPAE